MTTIRLKIFITLLLFSTINTSLAKEKVDTYLVYAKLPLLGEVEVQNIETKLTIFDNKFKYSYKVNPTKLIDFFDDKISSGYILGEFQNESISTNTYLFKTEKDDFIRTIKFTYTENIIDDVSILPSYDLSKITNVSRKMIDESIDPVTMFYMITNFEFIKNCNKIISVYDGKRRYDLILSDPKKSKNSYKCTLTHQKIAGYKPKKIDEDIRYVSDLKFLINSNNLYEFNEVSLRNNNTDLIIRKSN